MTVLNIVHFDVLSIVDREMTRSQDGEGGRGELIPVKRVRGQNVEGEGNESPPTKDDEIASSKLLPLNSRRLMSVQLT